MTAPPPPPPCLVCGTPTTRVTSNSRRGRPLSPQDTVSICTACADDWSATLTAIAAADKLSKTPPTASPDNQ